MEQLSLQHPENQPECSRRWFLKAATAGVAGAIAHTVLGAEQSSSVDDLIYLSVLVEAQKSAIEEKKRLQTELEKHHANMDNAMEVRNKDLKPIDARLDELMKRRLSKKSLQKIAELDSCLQRVIEKMESKDMGTEEKMFLFPKKQSFLKEIETIESKMPEEDYRELKALRIKRKKVVDDSDASLHDSMECGTKIEKRIQDLIKKIVKIGIEILRIKNTATV